MTEFEKVEREIDTLQENVRTSRRALQDLTLSAEGVRREEKSMELYQQHLDELLTKRDSLQVLISK